MNTSLLPIGNMFLGTAGLGPAPSRAAAPNDSSFRVPCKTDVPSDTEQSPAPPGDQVSRDIPESETTDNTSAITPKPNVSKSPPEVSHGPPKGMNTEVSREQQGSRELAKRGLTSRAADQPSVVQLWLAQYSQNAEHGKKGLARKVEPKAGHELAQTLGDLRAAASPDSTAKTAKSAGNKSPASNQTKSRPQAVFSNPSRRSLDADTQPDGDNNADNIKPSNQTLLITRVFANQQSARKFVPEPSGDAENKTTTVATEEPVIRRTSAFPSGQKTTPFTGKKPVPKAFVHIEGRTTTADGKQPATGKSAFPNRPEIPASNTGLLLAQGKFPASQPKFVRVGADEPPLVAEKPFGNEVIAAQPALKSSSPNGGKNPHNLSGDSPLQRLNVAQLKTSTGQAKDHGRPAADNGSTTGLEQPLSRNDAQFSLTESFPDVSTEAAKTPANELLTATTSVAEQITQSIHSSVRQGSNLIVVRLNPPELGKVLIKFQERQDQITGLLQVSKIQTRYEIEQVLPQIIRTLQDAGVQIKRFEVTLTDQSEQQPFRDQLLQDSSFQQRGSTGGSAPDGRFANEWLTEDNSYQDIPEPQLLFTGDSINMLI